MARSRPHPRRKKRTREHVLADLSVNFVERQVLLCGYSVQRIQSDYGIDLMMLTYNDEGEVEDGVVWFQLKATDKPKLRDRGHSIAVRVEHADVDHWRSLTMPLILVIYDASADRAYWLYVQTTNFRAGRRSKRGGTTTLHVPTTQVVSPDAIRQFKRFKDSILAQSQRVIRHEPQD